MRADDAADDVERVGNAPRPIAERFVGRIFERAGPALDGMHLCAEQLHHVDVKRLALDVDRAHEDLDGNAELRTDGRGRDAVLAGAGFPR